MHTPVIDKSSHRRTVAGAGGSLRQRFARLLVRSSCTTSTTSTTTTSVTAFVRLEKTNASPLHQEPPHSPCFRGPCVYERPELDDGSCSRSRRRYYVHSDARIAPPLLRTNDATKQSKSRGKPRSLSESSRRRSYSSSGERGRRPKRVSASYSADDESGEDATTRTLFSSLSFSSGSTSQYYHTTTSNVVARKSHKNAPRRASPRNSHPRWAMATKHHDCSDGRKGIVTKKLVTEAICSSGMAAVVKRSSNPYADFQSSMVEMVVEQRIASVGKMGELLCSYLSLNSPEHHPAILAAFEGVRDAIFGFCERPR